MRASGRLLGIDIGTSGLKASLFDESGNLLGQGYRASSYLSGPPGCAGQMPQQWWDNLCIILDTMLGEAQTEPSEIAGVGVCGFHHCPVFVDANGEPTRSVMLHHDERLAASRSDMVRSRVLPEVEALTRSVVSAGHFPPMFHYVRSHDAAGLERTRWILLAKDYIRMRLTDQVGTDVCDATGTNLVEPGERTWSDRLCDILPVTSDRSPPI